MPRRRSGGRRARARSPSAPPVRTSRAPVRERTCRAEGRRVTRRRPQPTRAPRPGRRFGACRTPERSRVLIPLYLQKFDDPQIISVIKGIF